MMFNKLAKPMDGGNSGNNNGGGCGNGIEDNKYIYVQKLLNH